ncbi:MAG: DUF2064 domain-containing protein [bacterium]
MGAVLVIAKAPVPGRVKTRLTPPFTPAEAAALAEAALIDSLSAAARVPARRHVLVLDGAPGPWLPDGWDVIAQVDGGLDQRLTAAFAAVPDGPAVLIGMDTPQVRPEDLLSFAPDRFDAALGLASDGGYWALGLRHPAVAAAVIPGVLMSRSDTGAEQAARLRAAGLRVQALGRLTDVDTAASAAAVAAGAPHTRFARRFVAYTTVAADLRTGTEPQPWTAPGSSFSRPVR